MKIILVPVVFLIFAAANLVPLAFDSGAAGRAELDAKSQLASSYLYDNIAAFR